MFIMTEPVKDLKYEVVSPVPESEVIELVRVL